MMLDYPEIITEFTMLTGAGMTAKMCGKGLRKIMGSPGEKREEKEKHMKKSGKPGRK